MSLQKASNKFSGVSTPLIITILIGLYAALIKPPLPKYIINLFSNTLFKIGICFLIIERATKDPQMAIMIAVAFIITHGYVSLMETNHTIKTIENMEINAFNNKMNTQSTPKTMQSFNNIIYLIYNEADPVQRQNSNSMHPSWRVIKNNKMWTNMWITNNSTTKNNIIGTILSSTPTSISNINQLVLYINNYNIINNTTILPKLSNTIINDFLILPTTNTQINTISTDSFDLYNLFIILEYIEDNNYTKTYATLYNSIVSRIISYTNTNDTNTYDIYGKYLGINFTNNTQLTMSLKQDNTKISQMELYQHLVSFYKTRTSLLNLDLLKKDSSSFHIINIYVNGISTWSNIRIRNLYQATPKDENTTDTISIKFYKQILRSYSSLFNLTN
jgi:hypothetical protein